MSATNRIIHLLSTPFIFALSVSLTSFAVFTTLLALATLLLRVSIVYVELVLAIARSAVSSGILGKQPASPDRSGNTSLSNTRQPLRQRRRRRSSSGSSTGFYLDASRSHSITSLGAAAGQATPRDYESVGGWRLTTSDEADEALWTGINARLELPALTLPSPVSYASGKRSSNKNQTSPSGTTKRRYRAGTESPEGYFTASGGGGESPALIMTTSKRRSGEGEGQRSSVSLVRLKEESGR